MRLFIAINFDEGTKQKILAVQQRLRQLGQGNFSRPENLHLSLAFLGEIPPTRVNAVKQAMKQTAVPPLTLSFDHVGRFARGSSDLWWIGLAENRGLVNLQKELCGHLAQEGFLLEIRSFSPHITLAREVRLPQQPDERALLGSPFTTQAQAISLMLSHRVGGTLTYTEQYRHGATAFDA